jgi:hypothetical protein
MAKKLRRSRGLSLLWSLLCQVRDIVINDGEEKFVDTHHNTKH